MAALRGKNLFDESGVVDDDIVSLSMGAPGGDHLKSAARTVSEAAAQLMVMDCISTKCNIHVLY